MPQRAFLIFTVTAGEEPPELTATIWTLYFFFGLSFLIFFLVAETLTHLPYFLPPLVQRILYESAPSVAFQVTVAVLALRLTFTPLTFAGATVQDAVAGLASTLPALSLARTAKEWPPLATVKVTGDGQAAKLAPSRLHSKVAAARVSVAAKPKVADQPDTCCWVIAVLGATSASTAVSAALASSQDAVAVLDAFHVVKLGTKAVDEVRCRVQQDTLGHRGRKGDPLYGIRTILRCGQEKLTDRQKARLDTAIRADDRHQEVHTAWRAAQQLRAAYHAENLAEGRRIAEQILATFPTSPMPEIARLGRTLKQWRAAFLAYFHTARSSNGGTEAINGLIELHRRIARGFRNRENYRLRMLLIGGGLNHPHLK